LEVKKRFFIQRSRFLCSFRKKDPEGAYDRQALKIVEKLKAASFENLLTRINVERFSDVPEELTERERALKFGLRELNRHIAEELSKVNPDMGVVRKLRDERRLKERSFKALKARLKKDFPAYAGLKYPDPIYAHSLEKRILDRDEAILEYMVTRSKTYVFAIDRRGFRARTIDYSQMSLQHDVEALLRPLHRADTNASWDPSVAYRLYDQLVRPVEYLFKRNKNVTIIPHGPLVSLPFEMLVCSKAHAQKKFWSEKNRPTYLIEKYTFCYAPSASALAYLKSRKRKKAPGWSLVAFGDADYRDSDPNRKLNEHAEKLFGLIRRSGERLAGQGLRPLSGARKGISEIARIVGGPNQTYLGREATESLFKKADLSRYCYVHLATHGVMLGGVGKLWRQPAVVFSLYGDTQNDGFLQLGEAFGLKLNSDLLVLTSCLSCAPTAGVMDTGIEGMSRAFLFAGADSVILSMWQVNDRSASRLFIQMYEKLKDLSRSEALRHAKLSLIHQRGTSHPRYWAPFVLIGNWRADRKSTYHEVDASEIRFKGFPCGGKC
jgi:CHAT domain-containing protein